MLVKSYILPVSYEMTTNYLPTAKRGFNLHSRNCFKIITFKRPLFQVFDRKKTSHASHGYLLVKFGPTRFILRTYIITWYNKGK